MIDYTITMFHRDIIKLEKRLKPNSNVYGVPKNGVFVSLALANYGHTIVSDPFQADYIVDDLVDSGKTRDKFRKYGLPFLTLVEKKDNEWIKFWFEKEENDVAESITRIIESIGEDPKRDGLSGTPERITKMYKEMFRGYDKEQKPKITIFKNGSDGLIYDEMIIDRGDFYSQCEHHMVPFFGNYWFAYIPDKKIVGLSKVARIVDYYSAKLQVQERLVKEILDELEKELDPLGIALIMEGEHLCKTMRGVRKKGKMTTVDLRGVFRDAEPRNELLNFINGGKE